MGYPMFMKPFDGGAWRGVSRIDSDHDLWAAYNQSGEMLMHLQKSVEPYDVFARALTIGPESMVMNFRPDEPMHNRYAVDHDFLEPKVGAEAVTIAQTVNAFFRWEFNSCEMLIQGDEVLPDRLRQRLPRRRGDVAALLLPVGDARAGQVVGVLRGDRSDARSRTSTRPPWFAVADDEDLSYDDKLAAYQQLADDYFERERTTSSARRACPTSTRWCSTGSRRRSFDQMLTETVVVDVPRARGRPVPRPLPRPARAVEERPAGATA